MLEITHALHKVPSIITVKFCKVHILITNKKFQKIYIWVTII